VRGLVPKYYSFPNFICCTLLCARATVLESSGLNVRRCQNSKQLQWRMLFLYGVFKYKIWLIVPRRNRVSPWAGVQFSTSVPGQLVVAGWSSAGVRQRDWWSAPVTGHVRSDDLQGSTPTTDSVHCRLRLRQRMVNYTTTSCYEPLRLAGSE